MNKEKASWVRNRTKCLEGEVSSQETSHASALCTPRKLLQRGFQSLVAGPSSDVDTQVFILPRNSISSQDSLPSAVIVAQDAQLWFSYNTNFNGLIKVGANTL